MAANNKKIEAMAKDVTSGEQRDVAANAGEQPKGRWQKPVGWFVALGCLVTAAYAIAETFWG